jgi:hypothetical protein
LTCIADYGTFLLRLSKGNPHAEGASIKRDGHTRHISSSRVAWSVRSAKGIAADSLSRLLISMGYRVRIQKLDPVSQCRSGHDESVPARQRVTVAQMTAL